MSGHLSHITSREVAFVVFQEVLRDLPIMVRFTITSAGPTYTADVPGAFAAVVVAAVVSELEAPEVPTTPLHCPVLFEIVSIPGRIILRFSFAYNSYSHSGNSFAHTGKTARVELTHSLLVIARKSGRFEHQTAPVFFKQTRTGRVFTTLSSTI